MQSIHRRGVARVGLLPALAALAAGLLFLLCPVSTPCRTPPVTTRPVPRGAMFRVEANEGVCVQCATHAEFPQAFRVWQLPDGEGLVYCGLFPANSSLYLSPVFPGRAGLVIVQGVSWSGDAWTDSVVRWFEEDHTIRCRFDDALGDGDFDDLVLDCRRVASNCECDADRERE